MSYTINLTNGRTLTSVVDGTIDQTSTDLTLVGKNATGYGVYVNDNFVHLLENFANSSQPNNPIQGQLWFDTTENRLKVYNGATFTVTGGTIVSNTVPSGITTGDVWINSSTGQLFFNDGKATRLAGPSYTTSQGVTGFNAEDVLDIYGISHTILILYVSQTVVGIFSADAFTPATSIAGYGTSPIIVGFNSGTIGPSFDVQVTEALYLMQDGIPKQASEFLSVNEDVTTTGSLTIQNLVPLTIGPSGNFTFSADTYNNLFKFVSNVPSQKFLIQSRDSSAVTHNALYIDGASSRLGVFTSTPGATLDVGGDAIIQGSLTVQGNLTTISTTNIEIKDKLIELAKVSSPSNSTADGGGILIEAGSDVDKTLIWDLASGSWKSTESVNIASGKTYKINGLDVLTYTSLPLVQSAPNLTSVGTLGQLLVSYLQVGGSGTESTISFVGNPLNGNIYLSPKGTGTVDVSSKKITSVATPTSSTDGTNKSYVDVAIATAPLGLYLDLTALGISGSYSAQGSAIASGYLSKVYPYGTDATQYQHPNGTLCRIVCSDNTVRLFQLTSGTWVWQNNL